MAEEEQLKSGANKKAKLSMLLGVILMLALGGGGFFLVYSGALFPPDEGRSGKGSSTVDGGSVTPLPNVAFVPIDPLIVNLVDTSGQNRHLRFQAQLEVPTQYKQEVETLLPRLVDVLNGYLRAVEVSELESPSALVRLRAQILRRLQIVAGEGRVNDVLIMEFVIN
ncbi:flagellar basal body-associated FliL family protein [Celeribacter halophilus]|uniref:Flagellar protein FliL n=1 Tax=Celeribacter halophilus TaxID=576117 RepID=A0A1I3UUL9_9RHOB|nr:flagellar basal body-associated FliL family protein [Celeribacter halophilus]PZX09986.1 flagellar FliL protein [Celeribacter halophilus]SFJ86443.1 flagellar FliL protein [Celeribacter halophilus]